MTKSDFYARYELTPDSGNIVTSWGAVQNNTGVRLLQCWNDYKTFIKKEDRTGDAIMVVRVLSPKDLGAKNGGGQARVRALAAIKAGARAFVAVSTGSYPDWINSANLDQVYPILSLRGKNGEIFAKVGPPVPTELAFKL